MLNITAEEERARKEVEEARPKKQSLKRCVLERLRLHSLLEAERDELNPT